MKRTMKRWLAMLLAVLMVMGTLPTTAWAARITDDEASEQPVLDPDDSVVDIQSRHDGEQEETPPVGPNDPPADQMAVEIVSVVGEDSISLGTDAILATGTPQTPGGDMDGNVAIAVLPWFKPRSDGQPVAATIDFNGDFANNENLDAPIDAENSIEKKYYGPIYAARIGGMPSTKVNSIAVNGKGQILVNEVVQTASQFIGSALDTAALITWATGKTTLYDGYNKAFNPIEDGYLPYRVYIGGASGYNYADIIIPLKPLTLGVEIEDDNVMSSTTYNYSTTQIQYTPVRIYNYTGAKLENVTVTIRRKMPDVLDTADSHYNYNATGGLSIAEDAGAKNIKADIIERYSKTPNNNVFDYTLNSLYGLVLNWDDEANKTNPVSVGELTGLTIPCATKEKPEENYITLFVGGTDGTNVGANKSPNRLSASSGLRYTEWGSNYTIEAKAAGEDPASDNGGIRWLKSMTIKPQVQMVRNDAAKTPLTESEYKGSELNGSLAASGDKTHELKIGSTGTTLTWDGTGGVWTGDEMTVSNPLPYVYIDGKSTGVRVTDGITKVPAYAVTVDSDPEEKNTETSKGHYQYLDTDTYKGRVSWQYYPKGTQVRVFANGKNSGWISWTSDGAAVTAGGQTGDAESDTTMKGYLTPTGDTTVTAHYAKPIKLATTYNGGDPGNTNVMADAQEGNRSTEYVWSVEFRAGTGGTSLTASKKADGSGYDFSSADLTLTTGGWWEATLAAGVSYTLYINGVKASDEFTSATVPTAQYNSANTDFNFIVELAGVTPKIVGTNKANSMLTLPDDKNPGRAAGNVTVTGAKPNTDGAITLYYPTTGNLNTANSSLNVGEAVNDQLKKVTYPTTGDSLGIKTRANGTKYVDLATRSRGTNELIATYGQIAEIWIYVDGTVYDGTSANNIVLKPKDNDAANDTGKLTVTKSSTAGQGYIYTSEALKDGVEYAIWVNGFKTSLTTKSTTKDATLDGVAHTYIPVPMQSVTVADQSGITTTASSSFSGGIYTAGSTSGNIPNGCTISVVHGTANNYAANGWTFAKGTETEEKGDFTYTASATDGSTASQGAQTLTAQYSASVGKATVNIFLDGTASDAPVNEDSEVALYKTDKVAALEREDTGIYFANVAPDTYNVYVNGEDTGIDIEVTTAGKSVDVKYWTVTVKDSDASTSATTGDGVYLDGTEVNISATAATYYNPATLNWNAAENSAVPGTSTTSDQTVTAKITVTSTSTYTPKFTKKTAKITVNFSVDGTADSWPTGYTSINVTGPDNKTWAASSTEKSKEYTLEQGGNYTVTDSNYSQTITALDKDTTVTIPYYTMKATTLGHGTVKVESGTLSATTTSAANNEASIVVPYHADVTWTATPDSNYGVSKWNNTADTDTIKTATDVEAKVEKTVEFTKVSFDTTLKVTLDGTNQDNGKIGSGKDIISVKLGTVAATYNTTDNAWEVTGVTGDNQSDKWNVETISGTYQVPNNGDKERDGYAAATLDLYSLETVDTDYDTDQATMTANGVADLTRAVIKKGDSVTLSVTAATGYTHVSWTEETSGKGDVAKASYKLTSELNKTQKLTPTFTYIASITPTVGATTTVRDVDTLVLTAKGAADTTTTVGTPIENTSTHKWTVTGLTIGTEYDIWINGYRSDKTVSAIDEVKVPTWTVSVVSSDTTAGSATLTTAGAGNTVMPNGATNTTGWTITAAASTGYRVADTAWALTAGDTYGTLADATDDSTKLTVATAIEGDVTATAYFTQQWDVTSYVSTTGVTSTATLTGGWGAGTSASHSTKTIDAGTAVQVTFTRADGEELNGWTLADGGAGKWYVGTTPNDEGAVWTTWAAGAVPTAESFYFKPSADSTITAAVKTKEYPVKIIVKLDGTDLTSATATKPVVKVNNVTLTYSDGAWTGKFTPGDYALTVGSVIDTSTQNLTNIKFSVADGEGSEGGEPANLTRTVKYWTVGVETDSNGTATMSSTNPDQSKSATPDTTSATARVLEGTEVTWRDSTPVTNYVFDKWQEKQADDTYADATPTAEGITAQHTYKALFKQKTGSVKVTVKLDGAQDDQSADSGAAADLHTVTLYQKGAGEGGAAAAVGTAKKGNTGVYTFTNVPYNEGAGEYYVTVVKKDAVTNAQTFTSADIVFSGNNGGEETVDAPYFTAIAATEGNGNASINFGGDGGTTEKTDYTDNSKKSVSFVVVSGTKVTWKAHEDKLNYTFDKWAEDDDTTATRSDVTVNSPDQILTAKFKKDAFNTYLYLTVNGDPYGETATDGTKDIKSVKLVTTDGGNTDAVTLANAAVTPTYDDDAKVWKAENVKSEGQEPYWRVETVDDGVYYTKASLDDKNNDVDPVIGADATGDKAVVREPLFGVVIEPGAGNGTGNVATLKAQTTSTAAARIVTRANEAAAVALNKKAGYTWASWLSAKGTTPTAALDITDHGTATTTATADGTFTLVAGYAALAAAPAGGDKDLHIKPTYTYEVTVQTVRDTTPTAPGGAVEVNGKTITADPVGVYKVTGLTPGDTEYVVKVNGFDSSVKIKESDANGTVDVKLFSVTMDKQTAVGSETIDGTAYIAFGSVATGEKTSLYLPIGAKTDDTHVVTVFATTGTDYRLKNGTGEKPWTEATYVKDQSSATTTVKTPDDGMAADITITADFVRRYTATTEVTGIDTPTSTATIDGPTDTSKTVDNGTIITVTFTKGTGESLKSWTGTNGTLYSDEDGTTPLPAGSTATTVYFKPTGDDAKVTATVEAAKYPVQVKVFLDNKPWGAADGRVVKLGGTALTYDATGKYWTNTEGFLPSDTGYTVSTNATGTEVATHKKIAFTAADAEHKTEGGDPDPKNTSVELYYYTIKLVADPGTDGTNKNTVRFTADAAGTADTTASKIFLATDAVQDIGITAAASTDDAYRYRFDNWEMTAPTNDEDPPVVLAGAGSFTNAPTKAAETFKLPAETTLKVLKIEPTNQITLTANFKQQFKVTVVRSNTATGVPAPQIKVTDGGNWVYNDNAYVLVDEGATVSVNMAPFISGSDYVFADWSIKEDSGAGEFDNAAHTVSAARGEKNKGYIQPTGDNVFKPSEDTVLELNVWRKGTLAAGWTYDKVDDEYTTHATGGADDGGLKWTKWDGNDPTLFDGVKLEYSDKPEFTTSTPVTLSDGNLTQNAGDATKYTFDKETFLKGRTPKMIYRVTFTYKLGTDGHPNQQDATAQARFTITATKADLIETKIWVEDEQADPLSTANADNTDRDAVIYRSHKETKIPTEQLVFTWYYADEESTAKAYADGDGKTALEKAKEDAEALSGYHKITDGVTGWGTGDHAIPTGTVKVTSDMKGKYIFAVVNVKDDSDWGQGAVITNSIPVDYDAEITVKEDGTALTAGTGYSVYLWPTDAEGTFAPDAEGLISTKFATDKFVTEKSALNAETSYNVYVQEVESDTTRYVKHSEVISRTKQSATVDYYTVTLVDVPATKVENVTDDAGNKAGETFTDYPGFTAATTNNIAVPSGKGVLKGTSVTAKAENWEQDYNLWWQKSANADNSSTAETLADVSGQGDKSADDATTTGYASGAVNAKTFIGGRLVQNTYTISGDVKATGNGQIVESGTGMPTLTFNEYTFNAKSVNNSGGNGATVTFEVPRSDLGEGKGAITGKYTLTATPKANPVTTLKGYAVPQGATTTTTAATVELKQVEKENNTAAFTIFVEATTLAMEVADDDDHGTKAAKNVIQTEPVAGAIHTETKVFANYTEFTKKITVTNDDTATPDVSNATMKVTPTLERYKKDSGGNWVKDSAFTAPSTDGIFTDPSLGTGKDVTFANWETELILEPGESHEITVTIPTTLENEDDVAYRLTFKGEDGRDGFSASAPTLMYELRFDVNPVTVTDVTTTYDSSSDTYTMATTLIKEDKEVTPPDSHSYDKLQKPTMGTAADTTNDDLVYKWYYADWDAEVELKDGVPVRKGTNTPISPATSGTTDLSGLKYKPGPDERGKALYLVVTGQNNATGAAMTPDRTKEEKPIIVSYGAEIVVNEDNAPIGNNDDDGYQVYLWRQGSDTFDPATAIKTTFVGTASDPGVFKTADNALWPCETNEDGTAKNDTKWVYDVYANIVKGTKTYQKVPGLTVSVGDTDDKEVDYYKVSVNATTYDNVYYDLKGSDRFFGTTAGSKTGNTGLTPGAKVGETDATNGWVQKGNDVTLTEKGWKRDYTLAWTGATKQGTDDPSNETTGSTAKITNLTANTTVDTKLTLNLYNVTAKVNGSMGKVEYFSMVLTDGGEKYTFTSRENAPDANAILGVTTSAAEILATQSVVFHLPKAGPYVTKATMPNPSPAKLINYTNTDGSKTATLTDDQVATFTIDVNVTGACSYAANLQGEGVALDIVDNIPTATLIAGVQLESSNPTATSKTSNANITPKGGGFEKGKVEAVQTIKLYYNSYTAAIPVTLTFSNQSKHDPDYGKNDLQNVKFVRTSCTEKPGDSITIDADPTKTEVTGTAGLEIPTVADGQTAVTKKVTLNIQPGLTVGETYIFEGTASFDDTATPTANNATTTYTLKVEILPLPFETVSTADDGSTKGKEYTVDPSYAADSIVGHTADSGADTETKLTYGTDYTYKWVSSANDVALTGDDLHWNAATGTVTVDNSVDCTGNGKDTKAYIPNDADQGRKLYLVIYAKKDTNATGAAISQPITQTYDGIVYVNNDGVRLTDPDTITHSDPGYAVQFIGQGEDPIKGVWKEVETGKYAYVSEKGLTPGKEYTVKVSRIPGETTPVMVELSKKLTGTKIGKTLAVTGTVDADNFTNVTQADYFTVNAVNFINKEYQTGTGETFAGDITPKFTIGTGTDKAELASGTPVLSGQSVAAKAPALTAPNEDKAWTQDYTLTWRNTTGNEKNITTDNGSNLADETNNAYKGQSNTAAIADGAYSYGQVTAKTFIGGRLDQKTYTVTGHISGSGAVKDVTMQGGTGNKVYGLKNVTPGVSVTKNITDNNTWTDTVNNNTQDEGDEYTFTVVKGTYTITGYEGDSTTIRKVTVDALTTAGSTRNTNKLDDVADNTRTFTIHLERAGAALGVKDSLPTGEDYHVSDETHQNSHDDNVQTYFFSTIDATNNTFDLLLNNPGNVALTLKDEPTVYRVDAGTDYTNFASFITNHLTSSNQQTVAADHTYTDTGVLTIASIPAANTAVAIGAGGTDAADPDAVSGGKVTVNTGAKNTADHIYVVKFASIYTDTEETEQVGPTVYYVFDLTVDPLPIEAVTAEFQTDSTSVLQLKDNDLDSVEVSYGTGTNAGAATRGLLDTTADADITYVWVTADSGDLDKDDFEINASNQIVPKTGVTATVDGTTGSKTRTITSEEQGKYLYLIAYRTKEDANASGLAVSAAMYAPVEVGIKAYRTGNSTGLTDVTVTGTLGEDTKTSNAGVFTVTGADQSIAFTAEMNDYLHGKPDGTADDPSKATYYFVGWKAEDADTPATDITSSTVTATGDLTMNYAVKEKSTVIGFYDYLPSLDGSSTGYDIGADAYTSGTDAAAEKAARTLHYEHNDGSGEGRVQIWIEPKAGFFFKDGTAAPKQIVSTDFEGKGVGDPLGGDGDYVLTQTWIQDTLSPHTVGGVEQMSEYIITFYDMGKGSKATDGYAGYDRSIPYNLTPGEKWVNAEAEDTDPATGIQGNGKVQVGTETPDFTSEGKTNGGIAAIHAYPNDGYKFDKWTHKNDTDPKGEFGDASDANTTFKPVVNHEYVVAHFVQGAVTVNDDAKAKVYYGDDEWDGTAGAITITSDPDAVNQVFSVELPDYTNDTNADALKQFLVAAGKAEAEANAIVTKAANTPAWLSMTVTMDGANVTGATFSITGNATGVNVVKRDGVDVEDEIVAYVKVTETNTTQVKYVPFTVDVMTSKLKIHTAGTDADGITLAGKTQAEFDGENYKNKFVAAYGVGGTYPDSTKVEGNSTTGEILHGTDVEAAMFEYLRIENTRNAADVWVAPATPPNANTAAGDDDPANGTVSGKGKWTYSPQTHTGAGENAGENSNPYTFTFTYDTGDDEEKWNYEGDSIQIIFPVQRPRRSLLIADAVANYAEVKDLLNPGEAADYSTIMTPGETEKAPVELEYTENTYRKNESITYLDTEPKYTVKFQRTGTINNMKLTIEPEAGKTTVGFEEPTQAQLDAIVTALAETGDVKEASLTLTVTAVHDKVWVGEHYIRFHLTGKDDLNANVDAYYTLSLTVEPRKIPEAHVSLTPTDPTQPAVPPTVDKVMGQNPTDPTEDVDLPNYTDPKDVTPVKPPVLIVDDTDPEKIKVVLTPDPNYEFEEPDTTPDPTDPDYTINGDPKDKTDEGPKIDKVGEDIEMTTYLIYIGAHLEKKGESGYDKVTGVTAGQPIADYVPFSDSQIKYPDQIDTDNTQASYGYGSDWWWSESSALNAAIDLTTGEAKFEQGKTYVVTVKVYPDYDKYPFPTFLNMKATFNDRLVDARENTTALFAGNTGFTQIDQINGDYYIRYYFSIPNPPSPGGGDVVEPCPCKVFYWIGENGVTTDATVEDVSEKNRPSKIPTVTPLDGYAFRGWSLTNPAKLKDGEKLTLVDPKTVEAKGESMTFYAVIVERPFHQHYVIGYPNGNFGPADDINRASVATIIARAALPGFVEGANYGNPGGYSDVSGHWAESAIAYCSKYGVFKGYTDGTFRPDQPISRQEFATVIARLAGELTAKDLPFTDIDEAGAWALNGIYTSYEKGWVIGYTDGTFKPLNNIRRDEAVKIFNGYLNRGVDADGLRDLHEYVHSGVASNNTENGVDEYMTWADVPKEHWAYYEIIEAANDHEYTPDFEAELGYTLPEHWEKCWIDERWRYSDDPEGAAKAAAAATVASGFRVWLH